MAKENDINRVGKPKDISPSSPPEQNGPILVDDIFRCFVAPGRFWTNYGMIREGRVYDSWQMASSYTVHA